MQSCTKLVKMKQVLQVEKLSKHYKKGKSLHKAVDEVSFTVDEGQIVGLVGQSGSGKSSIAKLICKLIEPTSGSIILNGKELSKLEKPQLKELYQDVQMVFQSPYSSFNPRKTIAFAISESMRNRGYPKQQIEERCAQLLLDCGLEAALAKRYPHELSGGQCQRAAIARALAIQPKLLICDEATSALDAVLQAQIIELLKSLHKSYKLSCLFICHNLALVQQFCDKVLVMYEGKIIEQGNTHMILSEPQHEYTKRLIKAASFHKA